MTSTARLAALALLSSACWVPTWACAADAPDADTPQPAAAANAPSTNDPNREVFSTGVAKGRDRLDSATSTSSLKASSYDKFGPRPLADVLRTMPGLRVESAIGEGNANITVRGLPLAAGGSKYMQIEEDGLPVLEFDDIFNVAADVYLRNDFNIAQIESIRGGSASTFASDSPGGEINLLSKTGETTGGAIQTTAGLDYADKRVDFDYGGALGKDMRFHFGGFYRSGEGPRHVGFDGWHGGQFKFNLTRQFANGYIRLYGKYLDDRSPTFAPLPVSLTGTNTNPVYANFAGFDIRQDSLVSGNLGPIVTLDGNNLPAAYPIEQGQHAVSKAVGLEAQFDVGGWTISDRMRYSANSGDFSRPFITSLNTVAGLTTAQGGAGATARYATGPNVGQLVPVDANGNGLLAQIYVSQTRAPSLNNFTNDLRANRVWKVGQGDLTVTAGLYTAFQTLHTQWLHTSMDVDIAGGARASMVNVFNAAGVAQTLNGYYAFSRNGSNFRRIFDVQYDVTAPYGSVNYHIGKLAVGGSLRYDSGRVRGNLFGADLGAGRIGLESYDINGDGVISKAETRVAVLPLTQPAPVHYDYGYVSYSGGANYRIAEVVSVFARYSRGARANADKILFTPVVSTIDGSVASSHDKYDEVRQLEGGFKFRRDGLTVNATAFKATANDHNVLNGSATRTNRSYSAKGVELEAGYHKGVFDVMAGATYTTAKIVQDFLDPTLNGNQPRHQPAWNFTLTPAVNFRVWSVGASVVSITKSYAQDTNLLVMPGFTTVDAFAQVRPWPRVAITLNVRNAFNATGIYEVSQSTVPANGLAYARAINGRSASASLRFDF
ncbi:TonB-dependent receptor [Novosphingobium sp.]|uniref:TonB-dependent receptor domain-containing protein n=1 Tax=Novosphingobium sp. TaxID=1874826 RepID=UPI00333F7B3C